MSLGHLPHLSGGTLKVAYLGPVTNSNGNCSQGVKRRLRLGNTAMEELGKVFKSKNVSLETQADIIHILILPLRKLASEEGRWENI